MNRSRIADAPFARVRGHLRAAALAGCGAAAGILATSVAFASEPDLPRWSAGAYVEVDDEDGYAVFGSLGYAFSPQTQLTVFANGTDAQGTATQLSTTGYGLDLWHSFGTVAVLVGANRWEDPDVLTATEFAAELEFRGELFSVALLGSVRESDFEPFEADAVVTLRGGRQVVIRATADCSIDDVGYGARVRLDREGWGAYATYKAFDYDEVACGFDSPGLEALARAGGPEFRQFAARATNALAVGASVRVGAENALLDSLAGAGFYWQPGRLGGALDLLRTEDFFTGDEADTISATLLFAATPRVDLDFTLGTTDSELVGSTAFAGIGVSARF